MARAPSVVWVGHGCDHKFAVKHGMCVWYLRCRSGKMSCSSLLPKMHCICFSRKRCAFLLGAVTKQCIADVFRQKDLQCIGVMFRLPRHPTPHQCTASLFGENTCNALFGNHAQRKCISFSRKASAMDFWQQCIATHLPRRAM